MSPLLLQTGSCGDVSRAQEHRLQDRSRRGAGADLTAGNKARITAQLLQAEARFLASVRIPSFWTLALQ